MLEPKQKDNLASDNKERMAKAFGALSHLANPDLWEKEEGAWERAVAEKYAIHEPFDYTKWQENLFDDMTAEKLCEKADNFWKEAHNG